MNQHDQADAAFNKIINNGKTLTIRKAAKAYWAAHNSDKGASEEAGKNLEQAIMSIPPDYRQPTLIHLEALNNCKESNDDSSSCYLTFATSIVDKIISTT